jgi:hypothetical protein
MRSVWQAAVPGAVVERRAGFLVALLAALALAAPAAAQDRPFVFSVTTAPDASRQPVLFSYDVGVGESAFRSNDTGNGPEQRFVAQASFGRWTLLGHAGLSTISGSTRGWQQGELLYSVLQQQSAGLNLAVGGGILHEAGGVNVLVARAAVGRNFDAWRLHGNLVLQAPLSGNRDEVDMMTSLGWSRRVTRSVALGVEAIGEDLEGFWESEEAEGGARLLVGPSLHVAPPGRHWQLSVAGGPTFHPSDTGRASAALRDLPWGRDTMGYAVRTAFTYGF